jgi:hypothetical protein
MCYFSYGEDGETMHTASDDIRCYKIVYKYQEEGQPPEYVSFYRGKTYKPGETYEAEFGVVEGPTFKPGRRGDDDPRWPVQFWHINEGLHVYSDQCAFSLLPRQTENVTDILVASKGSPCNMILVDEMLLIEAAYRTEAAVLWCRIPKGAHFYENQGGEIVTDTLYIVGEEEPENVTSK